MIDGEPADYNNPINEAILSLCLGGTKLGAAIYNPRDSPPIRVLREILIEGDGPEEDLLEGLLRDSEAQRVLVPSRTDAALIDLLGEKHFQSQQQPHAQSQQQDRSNEEATNAAVDIRPGSEFARAPARVGMRLGQGWLSGWGEECGEQSLRALAALLTNLPSEALVEGEDQVTVVDWRQAMHIDGDSLEALQIFCRESHANMHAGRKEGFSLFTLLNRARSEGGKRTLRAWLMRPLRSKADIEERHEAIGKFHSDPRLIRNLQVHFSRLGSVPSLLRRMHSHQTVADFAGIKKFVDAALGAMHELHESDPECEAVLEEVAREIDLVVDFEASALQGTFTVKPGIHPDFDRLKATYDALPEILAEAVRKEITSNSQCESFLNATYFPQLGFLVTIPVEEKAHLPHQDLQVFAI